MLGNQNILKNSIRIRENKHKDRNLVQKHYHQIHQILYVLENSGEIILNEQVHSFTQDSLAFITPYSPHSITSDTKMTVLVLEFEMDEFGNDMKMLLHQHCFDETRLINMNLFTSGNVRQLLRRMLYEQSQGKVINQMSMKICLSELLLILLRNRKEPSITNAILFARSACVNIWIHIILKLQMLQSYLRKSESVPAMSILFLKNNITLLQ